MSSVWDDPQVDQEEVTPLPEGADAVGSVKLSPERLEALATQVIEKVVREVLPEMAERIIRERLDEMLQDSES